MFQFSPKGLLISNSPLSSTIDELEHEFVFNIDSEVRLSLIEKYKSYNRDLKAICNNRALKQWIDGSFVTLKRNPADIDLVTFIDLEIALDNNEELRNFVYPNSFDLYGVDAYVIIVYPETHKLYHITQSDRSYWIDLFGKTKPNRQHKRISKGFLEIIV